MNCNCIEELRERIDTAIQDQLPEGFQDLDFEIGGFSFCINDNGLERRPSLPITGSYKLPKKRGDGLVNKKINQSFICNFCPLCGASATKEEAKTND